MSDREHQIFDILESLTTEISLYSICDELGLDKGKITMQQLAATLRFFGYEVYSKPIWDSAKKRASKETRVKPKSGIVNLTK